MKTLIDHDDFPASRRSTYLNAASVALMYRDAAKAVIEWQEDLAQNGTINFDEVAEEAVFDNLHDAAARLFNVKPEDIAVGSSATELISSLAWALAPGQGTNVVSTDVVFPSTIYPWARVARHTNSEVRFARGQNGYVGLEDILRLIDQKTTVVAISHVEFRTGQRYDLKKLAQAAHSVGALLIVDATQSAGMLPLDAQVSNIDAMITASYKWLCGPFGVAVMYVAPHLTEVLDPGLVGWRSHKDMWNFGADRLELHETAQRFEFSTMAYGCAIGLTKSIEYLLQVGPERIFGHTRNLADSLRNGLKERGVEIISPENDAERTAILAVKFPGRNSVEVAQYLSSQKVLVSQRNEFIRFSPHLYNTQDEIQRTLDLIDAIP